MFISRSSLWTYFDCQNADKTHTYLERSKSSPIDLSLCRVSPLLSSDPIFAINPSTLRRLKSLQVQASPESLKDITAQLSQPAPLLETLTLEVDGSTRLVHYPMIPATLFNGDLSPLRQLFLHRIRTALPWRNMVNLTTFTLRFVPPGEISTTQLLDFFENAPNLCKVAISSMSLWLIATNTNGWYP